MLRIVWLAIGSFAVLHVTAATASDNAPVPAPAQLPHWSYAEGEGPAQWAELSSKYSLCGEGLRQSPIDLVENSVADSVGDEKATNRRIGFQYSASPLRIVRQSSISDVLNSGHTIQINPGGESMLDLDGEHFRLVQFHFHAPSEHTLDGRRFQMEMHAVHQSQSGELAVVGVFIQSGVAHPTIGQLWAHIPENEGMIDHHENVEIKPGALLPAKISLFRYSGSLTTPPCNENVRWIVIAEPIELSEEQIETFKKFYPKNNRPLQPLNGRKMNLTRVDRLSGD